MDLPPVPLCFYMFQRRKRDYIQGWKHGTWYTICDLKHVLTGLCMYREVAALTHKAWDNAVKSRAFVAETLLSGAQAAEVLYSPWDDVVPESHYDATEVFTAGLDIKENLWFWHAAKDLWVQRVGQNCLVQANTRMQTILTVCKISNVKNTHARQGKSHAPTHLGYR